MSFEEQCKDKDVTGAVLREVVNHAKSSRLEKFEIPGAVTLTHIEWTPDTGLTTAAMKKKKTTAGVLQGGFGQNVRPLTTYELLLNHCDHIDHHSNAFDLAKFDHTVRLIFNLRNIYY